MEILLLNANPVVSRLIELCAKQVDIDVVKIDTLDSNDIQADSIVIVDDGVLDSGIKNILESTYMGYRVLLISKGFEDEGMVVFDDIVQKPFVPSRIIDIITSAVNHTKEIKVHTPNNKEIHISTANKQTTNILDPLEVDKIKQILDQNENIKDTLDNDDIEAKKIQAFKEHLLSDGIEITNEEEYIQSITKKPKKYKKALKELIDNAVDEIIDRVGKDSFKQAIKEDRVSIEFHIKEKES